MLPYHHYHTTHTLQSLKGKRRILETNDRLPLSIFLEFVSWEFFLLRMSNSLSHSSEIYPSLAYSLSYQPSLYFRSSLHHLFIPHVLMLASMRNYTRGNVSSQQKVAHELRLFCLAYIYTTSSSCKIYKCCLRKKHVSLSKL